MKNLELSIESFPLKAATKEVSTRDVAMYRFPSYANHPVVPCKEGQGHEKLKTSQKVGKTLTINFYRLPFKRFAISVVFPHHVLIPTRTLTGCQLDKRKIVESFTIAKFFLCESRFDNFQESLILKSDPRMTLNAHEAKFGEKSLRGIVSYHNVSGDVNPVVIYGELR